MKTTPHLQPGMKFTGTYYSDTFIIMEVKEFQDAIIVRTNNEFTLLTWKLQQTQLAFLDLDFFLLQ